MRRRINIYMPKIAIRLYRHFGRKRNKVKRNYSKCVNNEFD